MENFDLIVVGGGPAGYVAAIRAAQLGFKTACIEKRSALGGTCLNIGCIPSKALLESSEQYHQIKTKASKHGVLVDGVKLDLSQMMKRKEATVRQLTNGVAGLFKKHKIEWVNGHGKFTGIDGNNKKIQVSIEGAGGKTTRELSAPRVLIATGSYPVDLPFLKFDEKTVVSSTGALEFTEVPKHLVIIGGGVIGLELGSVWSRLGAKVTVVEFQDRILPMMDKQLISDFSKILVKQGIEFKLNTKCTGAKVSSSGVVIEAEDRATNAKIQIECDKVLVATGRRPYTENLGLETVKLATDKAGRIQINNQFQTEVPGIYAVGDVVVGPMLAHKAEEEGIAAVEIMAGMKGHVNYNAIPSVIYTWPEVASVGATEEELKEKGVPIKVGSFPFIANGRAKAMDEIEGSVKVIAHADTDKVLGVHIVGPRAGDLIAEGTSVIEFGKTSDEMARTCHSHPTLAEVMKEAALAVAKRQIHL